MKLFQWYALNPEYRKDQEMWRYWFAIEKYCIDSRTDKLVMELSNE